jgi:hypothetical protein
MKFDFLDFFEKLLRKFTYHQNITITTGIYMKNNILFPTYLSQFFLEWKMFQTKFAEEIKKHFVLNHVPPPPFPQIMLFM